MFLLSSKSQFGMCVELLFINFEKQFYQAPILLVGIAHLILF